MMRSGVSGARAPRAGPSGARYTVVRRVGRARVGSVGVVSGPAERGRGDVSGTAGRTGGGPAVCRPPSGRTTRRRWRRASAAGRRRGGAPRGTTQLVAGKGRGYIACPSI